MAEWGDLVEFVRSEYEVIRDEPGELRILVEYADRRSQVIIISRDILDNREDWVQVASLCGLVTEVDLHVLLKELGEASVVCGAVIMGEHVLLRHALPLENLDLNEFTDPLTFVADTADHIEEVFFGGDGY